MINAGIIIIVSVLCRIINSTKLYDLAAPLLARILEREGLCN